MIVQYCYFGVPIPPLTHETQTAELPADSTIERFMETINTTIDDTNGNLLEEATFMVNKMGATRETVLHHGDEVIIMHAIGGG